MGTIVFAWQRPKPDLANVTESENYKEKYMQSSHVSIHLEVELGNRISLEAPLRGVLDLVVDVLDVPVHILLSPIHRY